MKKTFSRFLCALLAVVLALNGFLPLLPQGLMPHATAAEIASPQAPTSAFSLPAEPLGEERTSGEWRYALRSGDGYAVVTGYDGASSHPAVPAMLGGTDVVGIASGAFSHAPEGVTLHGNILWIADEAFGSSHPVVHALNGTYALYWANENGFAWVNTSEGVFQPDVVDFSDAPHSRVRRRGDTYVQLGALEARRVSVGSIFWMKDGRGTVFFYRITALSQQGGAVVATVEVPEVGDAVRELELTQTIEITEDDFVPAEGVTLIEEHVQSRSTTSYTEPMDGLSVSFGPVLSAKISEKWKGSFSVDATYQLSGTVTYTVEVHGDELTHYAMTENNTKSVKVAIKPKATTTITKLAGTDAKKPLLNPEITVGKVVISTGWFAATIDCSVGFELQGEITFEQKSVTSLTQQYNFDKEEWEVIDQHASEKTDEDSFAVGAAIRAQVYFQLRFELGVFHIVKVFEARFRGGFEAQAKANSQIHCGSLIVRPFATVSIYVGVWLKFGGAATDGDAGFRFIKNIEMIPKTVEMFHLHISAEEPYFHKAADCPFGASCTVKFLPRNGETFEDLQVIRGYPIGNLNAPWPKETETTGKFLGWSTEIGATEPNFEIGQYDGTPVESNLTLYGIWEKAVKVSFSSEGGVVVDPQYVPVGGLVAEPPKPEREGYTFVGWYLGSTSSQRQWRFDTDAVPAEGLTLYAMWRNDATGSITDSQGTQQPMVIGESGFSIQTYQSTADYFNYTIQKIDSEPVGVTITGLKSNATHVRIPNYLTVDVNSSSLITDNRELKVLSFTEDMFRGNKNLIAVDFEYSASGHDTSSMFSGCTNLQFVDMRGIQISSVSSSMFSGCSSLRTVIFPAGIKSIGSNSFYNCVSLPTVELLPGIDFIDTNAFRNCSGITELELGSVQTIQYSAFSGCTGLTELYIPDSVETLGVNGSYGPFGGCVNLEKISVGGVDTLTEYMLRCDSSKLKELTIRGTVKTIAAACFDSYTYPQHFTYYGLAASGNNVRVIIEEGVTSIGAYAFERCTDISELILPSTLTTIGSHAFINCWGLEKITFAQNSRLNTIKDFAFYHCTSLQALELPDSLRTIGEFAFNNCSGLTKLDLGEGVQCINYNAFQDCTGLTELYIPDSVRTLQIVNTTSGPFVGCTNLKKISVGGVSTLTKYMLHCGSTKLEELTIRGTVKTIGDSCFNPYKFSYTSSDYTNYYGLYNTGVNVRVIIEEGVTSIGNSAFEDCTSISELVLPSTLTTIGNYAFLNCTGLKTVTYADSDQSISIGSGAFYKCTSLEAFDFPAGLTSIGDSAFTGCTKLRSVELPDSLETIGSSAFYNCSGMEYLDLGAGVQTINANAFANCTSLTDLYIPDSVQTLSVASSKGPFASCTSLKTISVGGVETLSPYMLLCGSTQLEKLTIRGTVKTIAASAFSSSSSLNYGLSTPGGSVRVIIEEGVTYIGAKAFYNCTGIAEIQFPSILTYIGTSAFSGCKKLQSANLSNTVLTTLGGGAFSGCTGLKTVTLPDTLKTIPTDAFYNCSGMEHLDLGQGVQTIDYDAFANCSSLRELYLPDSLRTLSVRSSYGSSGYTYSTPFAGCTGLKKISVGGLDTLSPYMLHTGSTQLEELTIRSTVRLIDQKCFAPATHTNGLPNATKINYGLSTPGGNVRVVIGEGVYIHTSAFSGCSGISEVVLASGVTVGPTAFSGCSGLRHVYLPSTVKTFYSNTFDRGTDLVVHVIGEAPNYVTFLTENGVAVSTSAEVPYTLTLNANGGEFAGGVHMQAQTVCWLSTLPALRTPQNGDKLFCGWFADEACTLPFTGDTMPARSLTLYAGWDINVYPVTLNLMGGTLEHALSFKAQAGTNPVADLVPMLDNRSFTGWYTDRYTTVPFDGVMPKGSLTLYAGYIKSGLNGEYAFENGEATLTAYHMVELESDVLYLPESVNGMPLTSIAAGAFGEQNIQTLYLPRNLRSVDPQAFEGMSSLERIEVRPGNTAFASRNGVLYSADGTTLVHYPARAARTVALPESVRVIGAYAFAENPITSIRLSKGLERIEHHAFSRTNLSVVDLPQSLASLGAYAFSECASLLLVRCGDGVEEIGENCFNGCSGFMAMFGPLPPSAAAQYAEKNHILYNYYTLTLSAEKTSMRQVQAGAALELPSSANVGENAYFTGWYETADASGAPVANSPAMPQRDLTLYAGSRPVFTYETAEADGAQALILTGWDPACGQTAVTVPASIGGVPVTGIAAGCFTADAQRISVPASVLALAEGWAPEGCEIIAPSGSAAAQYAESHGILSSAPKETLAFAVSGGASLPDVLAPSGTLIALPVPVRTGYAFAGWYLDSALTQPAPLDENGLFAMPSGGAVLCAAWTLTDEAAARLTFTYEETEDGTILVTGLADGETALVIPETLHGLPVTAIRSRAFAYEAQLLSAAVPGSIASVPESAFAGCTSLASVTLGEGVEQLEKDSFAMCSSLRAIALPQTLTHILSGALSDTALTALHLPASLVLIESDALNGCDRLSAITVDEASACYEAADGVLYDTLDDKLVRYPAGRAGSAYTVRDETCVIGSYAFHGAPLETITLPSSVWSLEKAAFAGCRRLTDLPNLTSPMLTVIPASAFAGCYALKAIALPANIRVIKSDAFAACVSLTDVSIPDTVTLLEGSVFSGSAVTLTGKNGSAAQLYAQENGLLFIDPDATILPSQLTLSAKELLLQRGETARLTASFQPEDANVLELGWHSSHPNLVSVTDDGSLRALAAGSATITAMTTNGLTASCEVTVDASIPVDSIVLNLETASLLETATLQLSAALRPANATAVNLTWSSDDESVCTVDENGLVTARAHGVAHVQAETESGLAAVCTVEVLKRVAQLDVHFPASAWHAGETAVPEIVILPADAADPSLRFSASPADAVQLAPDGSVTFLKPGFVTLTVTAADLGVTTATVELECLASAVWQLPASLLHIREEAFAGSPAQAIILPDGALSIADRAFAGCAQLYKVVIPETVAAIADTAFDGCEAVIVCSEGSYAWQWASDHGMETRPAE